MYYRNARQVQVSKCINMKKLFVVLLTTWMTNVFAQAPANKVNVTGLRLNEMSINDTSLKVMYADSAGNNSKPAYFVNHQFVSETLLTTLNPMLIADINVIKKNAWFNNIEYDGQIQITTKNNYQPQVISLHQLKEKYTNLKNKPAIFMIDGVIINGDYDSYVVDESNLLRIIIDKVENTKENIDLGLIKLLTKSEENIKKSKQIRIRGTEQVL